MLHGKTISDSDTVKQISSSCRKFTTLKAIVMYHSHVIHFSYSDFIVGFMNILDFLNSIQSRIFSSLIVIIGSIIRV